MMALVYMGITGVDLDRYAFKYAWLLVPDEDESAPADGA